MPDLWTEDGWLEVKLPGETLDPHQLIWHAQARDRGILVRRVDSVTKAVYAISQWRGLVSLREINGLQREAALGRELP